MIKNIIFDFDGTLVDSSPGIVKTFGQIAKELTTNEITEQQITQLIGLPLAKFLSILLNTDDHEIINKGSVLFREYYSKDGINHNVVYPGIEEMLISLKNLSCRLFIVSNRIELFLKKILKQHGLEKYFVFVRGTDGTDAQSKKADYVKDIIAKYQLNKEETIIVGDTDGDIAAGKENSIYSVGITWGYGAEAGLIKAKADMICRAPQELQQFIEKT
ncbi:MAG: HAD hydrolase-like protein [Patescibacteria group bacterium]